MPGHPAKRAMTDGKQGILATASAHIEAFFDRGALLRFAFSLAHGMNRDGVVVHASAMAFDLFLSLIPLLALAGWLSSVLLQANPEALRFVSALMDSTPVQVHLILETHFGRFAGGIAPLVAVVSLYMASNAFHTAMLVFEHATGAKRRSWWIKRAIALACVFAVILALTASALVAVGLVGGPARTLQALLGPARIPVHARYVAYAVGATMGIVFLAGFFRIAVHHPHRKRHVWRGAVLTVGLGLLISWGFAQYLTTIARYALYYGSLATVAMTLVWVYLWCVALLVGMELNAQLEQEERRHLPRPSPTPRVPRTEPRRDRTPARSGPDRHRRRPG